MESQYFRNSYSNCQLQYVTIPTVKKPARRSPRREMRTPTTWVMLLFRCSLLHLFQFDFFYALPSLFVFITSRTRPRVAVAQSG
jgi:hypothetical protein